MDVEQYLENRRNRRAQEPKYRVLCETCLQPDYGCYCQHLQAFDPGIKFVILIHPIELRRRIATGRMSHLMLKNSELITGHDYSANRRVNEIIADTRFAPLILYPGAKSTNLTPRSCEERSSLFPADREPVLFVIDGTWATARQMMNKSENLKKVPRICFSPDKPSNFRVRKQPAPGCYSTIEAIHHTLDLLSGIPRFQIQDRQHDRLIHVFDRMVEKQLEFVPKSWANPRRARGRAFKNT